VENVSFCIIIVPSVSSPGGRITSSPSSVPEDETELSVVLGVLLKFRGFELFELLFGVFPCGRVGWAITCLSG